MFLLSAVSVLVLMSMEGLCAQQQQTVSVQLAWNNSGLDAVKGKNGFTVFVCVCLCVRHHVIPIL